jgi:UDPglucose 6-dehydrogenase
MTISVIGTGFVGVVTSAVFASFGHKVFGVDIDQRKVDSLNKGQVPFFEPDLEQLVQQGVDKQKLFFTTDYELAVPESQLIVIAVGTPSAADGTADLRFVLDAGKKLAPHIDSGAIIAIKSTVPPGANQKFREVISSETSANFSVVSLPEFLKEGSAVADTLKPDRVVIGADDPGVIDILLTLHEPLSGKRIVTSPESAQMAKYTANAYLAQRITFINQIADLCEINGAHIGEVIEAIGADRRIGNHYWYPGLGYGGSCFPKDVKELAAYVKSIGEPESLLPKINQLNEERIEKKLDSLMKLVGDVKGMTVAILGLSFKKNTNDMREAPSLTVIPYLQKRGAIIKAFDPKAIPESMKFFPKIFYGNDVYDTMSGAGLAILLVEWPEFTHLDVVKMYELMKEPYWFFDSRNQYSKDDFAKIGFNYVGIGNP